MGGKIETEYGFDFLIGANHAIETVEVKRFLMNDIDQIYLTEGTLDGSVMISNKVFIGMNWGF